MTQKLKHFIMRSHFNYIESIVLFIVSRQLLAPSSQHLNPMRDLGGLEGSRINLSLFADPISICIASLNNSKFRDATRSQNCA